MSKQNKAKRRSVDEFDGAQPSTSKKLRNEADLGDLLSRRNKSKSNGKSTFNIKTIAKSLKVKAIDSNNNAVPVKSVAVSKNNKKPVNVGNRMDLGKQNFVPIIQTCKMKAKEQNKLKKQMNLDKEIEQLDQIDKLTDVEIAEGEKAALSVDDEEVNHDGIILSVSSDLEDDSFPEEGEIPNVTRCITEPGEVDSSEEKSDVVCNKGGRPGIPSKVVKVTKVNKTTTDVGSASRSSRLDKFSHLRNDPDFKVFLNEMLDDRIQERSEN